MKRNEIEQTIALRNFIIECHSELTGGSTPATAVIKQSVVAYNYAEMIKKIDNILGKYVEMK